MRVLIVEDHEILSRNLQTFLKIKNIDSLIESDGKQALYEASINNYDLIILDINLPEINGDDICIQLREKWVNTPILMLTSRSSKQDMITGLDIWADDYMVKPFDYDELYARLKTLTRRNLVNKSTTHLYFKEYDIHVDERIVTKNQEEIKLSKLEFDLLLYFVQNKWQTLSKKELYEKVWGEYDEFSMGKTVDVYIWYLRKKFWKDTIETKKWIWYLIP